MSQTTTIRALYCLLLQVLVERVGGKGRSGDGGKQKSSRAMQLVVLLVVVVYVYVLGGMLVSVATKGTSTYILQFTTNMDKAISMHTDSTLAVLRKNSLRDVKTAYAD